MKSELVIQARKTRTKKGGYGDMKTRVDVRKNERYQRCNLKKEIVRKYGGQKETRT